MDFTKEEKETLKQLSKEFFGSSSRWQKMLTDGIREVQTRTVVENVPGENGAPDTQKTVKVPVTDARGNKQFYQRYFTPETLMAFFLEVKQKRDEFIEEFKKQQALEQAKKAEEARAQKLQEELGGSALS